MILFPARVAALATRRQSVYSCPQDDVVFVPGAAGAAPPEQMETLLYT